MHSFYIKEMHRDIDRKEKNRRVSYQIKQESEDKS